MKARVAHSSMILGAVLAAGGFVSAGQVDNQNPKHTPKHFSKPSVAASAKNGQSEGERVFAEHCSRCHNAPESFSPRIAGTITQHMRVRANLSPDEERAVLKFFNP